MKDLQTVLDALERYQTKRQDFDTFTEAIATIKQMMWVEPVLEVVRMPDPAVNGGLSLQPVMEREELLLREMRYIASISNGQVHRIAMMTLKKLKAAGEAQPVSQYTDIVSTGGMDPRNLAQQHNTDPSCTTVQLAEMILSDCGCSSNNTSLVSRVANRIDAHMQATQPVQASTDFHVLSITTAYEQGVGKGHQAFKRGNDTENPYTVPSDCAKAWDCGYEEGKIQASRLGDKT